MVTGAVLWLALAVVVTACGNGDGDRLAESLDVRCQLVPEGYGPPGRTPVDVEIVASGLEVPWGIAWLPGGDMLITQRAGSLHGAVTAPGTTHQSSARKR